MRAPSLEAHRESMDAMSEQSAAPRIELSQPVRAILEANTPNSRMLGDYLRFLEAIIAQDGAGIDGVITADARFHELEAIGLPPGPQGLKIFRQQVNGACPDEHISITDVRFVGDDILEADLDIRATHTGMEMMGIPAAGRKIRFGVGARNRFVDGRLAERWDVADFNDIRRQLTESGAGGVGSA